MKNLLPSAPRFKYLDRPGSCRECGLPAWWNGSRLVTQVRQAAEGMVQCVQEVRRRARCSDRACPAGSWTVYEEGGYPHRVFQLSVVQAAVVRAGTMTATAVAGIFDCSRWSIVRWVRWVAGLFALTVLARACARLDPTGMPQPRAPRCPEHERALSTIVLLDHFVLLLRQRGVRLVGAALSAILCHHHRRLGAIAYLTRSSPPLHVDLRALLL